MISFASDYLEGAHPDVLRALAETNAEQTTGYGLDPHCRAAEEAIRRRFGVPGAAVHFAVGGTQVNALIIAAALRPYEGVLCADSGHINVHETGAPEATGHKILPLPAREGKITGAQVREAVAAQADFEHTVRPGMVYISSADFIIRFMYHSTNNSGILYCMSPASVSTPILPHVRIAFRILVSPFSSTRY